MNRETKWNSAGNTPREKTHTNTRLNTPTTENPRDIWPPVHVRIPKRTEYKYMLNFVSHILCDEMSRKNIFLSDLIALFFPFLTICHKYTYNSKMEEAMFNFYEKVLIKKYPFKSL